MTITDRNREQKGVNTTEMSALLQRNTYISLDIKRS